MSAALQVITNKELFRYIQSFRTGFTRQEHKALKVIKRAVKKWRDRSIWWKFKKWFNEEVRLSVPLVWVPAGPRQITVDLTSPEILSYHRVY
jgi:hypothetical protein